MRRILTYLLLLTAVLTAGAGCSRPKKIPDRELQAIFKESFIANAYYEAKHLRIYDSLDIYRPIIQKHGYTLRDFEHTIQKISRQKSAKLSDVVEKAINELQEESRILDGRVAVRDTVNAMADRMFMRTVLFEPEIRVTEIKDTGKLRIRIPVEAGEYEVSYFYFVDSLDTNRGQRTTGMLIDSAGGRYLISEFTGASYYSPFQRRKASPPKITARTKDKELELVFGSYPKEMKKPHLTIDSLRVTYFLPREQALDSLTKKIIRLHFPPYADEKAAQKVSIPLRPDPYRVDTVGTGDAR